MNNKLTDKELSEPMMVTWGRIRTAVLVNEDLERAKLLVEKFQKDIDQANIEENYFGKTLGDTEIPF